MTERARIEDGFNQAIDAGEGVIEIGDVVLCDECSTDFTDDDRSGGFLFCGYAVGPCCAQRRLVSIRGYNAEHLITAWCPPWVSFADWVRTLRGPDARITVSKRGGGSLV